MEHTEISGHAQESGNLKLHCKVINISHKKMNDKKFGKFLFKFSRIPSG